MIIAWLDVTCEIVISHIYYEKNKKLPLSIWIPYELSGLTYFLIYFWSFILAYSSTLVIIVSNGILCSHIIYASDQFDILKMRLIELKNCKQKLQKNLIIKAVEHHLDIFKYELFIYKSYFLNIYL